MLCLTREERKILLILCLFLLIVSAWRLWHNDFSFKGRQVAGIKIQNKVSSTNKININKADSLQLQVLPGIGPKTAQRIIEYRNQHGPFTTIGDLIQVKGLGPKKIEALSGQIDIK